MLIALTIGVGACDDSVPPTVGTEEGFTIWGYLDPTADLQALRIVPIGARLGADPGEVADATVRSTELGTGRTATWRDSLVTFDDGTRGHVFVTETVPTPGERVRIEVARSDGNTASVEVAVPPIVRPELDPPVNGVSMLTYPLRVRGAPRVNGARLFYRMTGVPPNAADTVEVELPDLRTMEDLGGGTWAADLEFIRVSRAFLNREYPGLEVKLVDVRYEAFVADAGWAFTPEQLQQFEEPGTVSNVTNGFGFVGAGYWTSVTWTPSPTSQTRAGFFVEIDPALPAFFNEASYEGWVELYNPTVETIFLTDYILREGNEGDGGALYTIPTGISIPAGGFVVLTPGFPIVGDMRLELLSPRGDLVRGYGTAPSVGTAGSMTSSGAYPDGFTQILPDRTDLFQRSLEPTPGAPNRPGSQPMVINEIYAAGADGWAEAWLAPFNPQPQAIQLAVVVPGATSYEWVSTSFNPNRFGVVPESEAFSLPTEGGGVLLRYRYPQDRWLVSDYRVYGPQAPKASDGYLPDGLNGTWTRGLIPSPAASNSGGLP